MINQSITLANGETLHFQLEHRQRRTIGLKITAEGLIVHAPKQIADWQLQKILQDKSHWIIKKLTAHNTQQVPKIQWKNGENLFYLGNEIILDVQFSRIQKAIVFEHNRLIVALPDMDNAAIIRRKILQWFKKQAMGDFARRLEILSAKLGVTTPPLTLSNAKSRWGSCNSHGEIRLNWRLIQAPPQMIQYVICHELAHLKEMNHSSKFWAVVAQLFPTYKLVEKELKQWSLRLHAIDSE